MQRPGLAVAAALAVGPAIGVSVSANKASPDTGVLCLLFADVIVILLDQQFDGRGK